MHVTAADKHIQNHIKVLWDFGVIRIVVFQELFI